MAKKRSPTQTLKQINRSVANGKMTMRQADSAIKKVAVKKDGRRTKSAAHRKAISDGLKAYWARQRTAKHNPGSALLKARPADARKPKKVVSKDGGPWGNMGASVANAARAAGFKNKTEWKNAGSPNQAAMKKLAAKRKSKSK